MEQYFSATVINLVSKLSANFHEYFLNQSCSFRNFQTIGPGMTMYNVSVYAESAFIASTSLLQTQIEF